MRLGDFAIPIVKGYGYNTSVVKVIAISYTEYLVKDCPWNSAVWAPKSFFKPCDFEVEDTYTDEEWSHEIPYENYVAVVEYETNRDNQKLKPARSAKHEVQYA